MASAIAQLPDPLQWMLSEDTHPCHYWERMMKVIFGILKKTGGRGLFQPRECLCVAVGVCSHIVLSTM